MDVYVGAATATLTAPGGGGAGGTGGAGDGACALMALARHATTIAHPAAVFLNGFLVMIPP
jgi:hypothetical protein